MSASSRFLSKGNAAAAGVILRVQDFIHFFTLHVLAGPVQCTCIALAVLAPNPSGDDHNTSPLYPLGTRAAEHFTCIISLTVASHFPLVRAGGYRL